MSLAIYAFLLVSYIRRNYHLDLLCLLDICFPSQCSFNCHNYPSWPYSQFFESTPARKPCPFCAGFLFLLAKLHDELSALRFLFIERLSSV